MRDPEAPRPARTAPVWRAALAALGLAGLMSLSACGGGAVSFDVGVLIDGQSYSGGMIQSGLPQSIGIRAGSSVELDASEPVRWTLQVGNTLLNANGASVTYQGVSVAVTALSPSRIAIDTYSPYWLSSAVPIRLTAVSTYDAALVATVDVYIGN